MKLAANPGGLKMTEEGEQDAISLIDHLQEKGIFKCK